MNARAIAFIACRIMAIYLMITYVLSFCVEVAAYLLGGSADRSSPELWSMVAGLGMAVVVYALIAVFLWFGASLISRSLSRPFPEKFAGDMDFDRWYALVVAAIGALAVLASAKIFGSAIKAFTSNRDWSMGALKGGAFFLVAGVLLMVLPRSVVSGLNVIRRWGGKPMIEDKQP